ncbi:MAG: hypothetical protein H0Z18_08710 [Thermococcus sp.]|uniref:hypothetical protein n=1 Tax=Thermococcus sp. TaxID=35749 RepID=UPI001DAB73D6|nr:hypothetical protein [Thermococcus sp.]MBO8175325.1 hypothetical protein [Thermococcus sp.]
MVSFPEFIGVIVGSFDAINRTEKFKWKISVVLWLSGLALSLLGSYFNPEFAVSSFMKRLLVQYIVGFFIGELAGIAIRAFLRK